MKLKEGFWGLKDGWKDRGEVESLLDENLDMYAYRCCLFDNSIARIAIKGDKRVLYCPKCLTILKED